MALLNVNNLSITDTRTQKRILNNVSFKLLKNECLGIVGQSGSGKTITAKEILKVNPSYLTSSGDIEFMGKPITNNSIESIRGKEITMILQDGTTAFNPLYKMGRQMTTTFQKVLGVTKNQGLLLSKEVLASLNFSNTSEIMNKYPHELSGGMLQRCMIAIALVLKPKIIIADEPTSALDLLNQLEMIKEIERIINSSQTSFILISHDLEVVRRLAQKIIVLKDGTVVESGNIEEVFNNPVNPYTQQLIQARQKLLRV